ncbi:type II secretion system F family protein [Myxococcota bacterium]|nr:type II secretion system F family protein [Myxococcota bacterium]MBU1534309.1 type II secretion system F family protein [Myxococcota bacterium]
MLGFAILFFFVSTFVLSLYVFSVITKALEMYEEKYATKGTATLGDMFLFISPAQLVTITLIIAFILGLLGFVIFGIFGAIVLFLVGFAIPMWGIKILRKKRVEKFDKQLVDALAQLSAAFKAGLTLQQGMESIAKEVPNPLGQELGLTVKEIKLGLPVEEALENLNERVGSQDLDLVVTATNVSRKLGGNMAEMFDIIAATIRERFRLEGKIKALTSQGKMQAWVVGLMPFFLGIALNIMRPDLMGPFLGSTFGKITIAIIIVMEAMGIWWIYKIVDIDV